MHLSKVNNKERSSITGMTKCKLIKKILNTEITEIKDHTAMVSYRISTPPNKGVCGTLQEQFKSLALQCQTSKIVYHPTCAQMPLYYMVRYASANVSFVCEQ